jgi:hypothetical protein
MEIEDPPIKPHLFCVIFSIRPAPWHPMFFEWQFGRLYMWLFASSDDDAKERAEVIVDQLPYELAGTWCKSLPADDPILQEPQMIPIAREARHTGLALSVAYMPTGTDEEEFNALISS